MVVHTHTNNIRSGEFREYAWITTHPNIYGILHDIDWGEGLYCDKTEIACVPTSNEDDTPSGQAMIVPLAEDSKLAENLPWPSDHEDEVEVDLDNSDVHYIIQDAFRTLGLGPAKSIPKNDLFLTGVIISDEIIGARETASTHQAVSASAANKGLDWLYARSVRQITSPILGDSPAVIVAGFVANSGKPAGRRMTRYGL